MNPHDRLMSLLQEKRIAFRLMEHPPCRTSAESAEARAKAGVPGAVGAKALVLRLSATGKFNLIVLPGPYRLDSKAVRHALGSFRFASEEELDRATGLKPGMVPPFGIPILPNIDKVYVDAKLRNYALLGFNAACLTKSIAIATDDYLAICQPISFVTFAII